MDSIAGYDYELPLERIAQNPMDPRENAKLMILPQNSNEIIHSHIRDFVRYLRSTDVLVLNNTRVFKARLIGSLYRPNEVTKTIELFLVRPNGNNWVALAKPGKYVKKGLIITIEHNFTCEVVRKHEDGSIEVYFGLSPAEVIRLAEQYGSVPVPPYIKTIPDAKDYQTTYAKVVGSVAAPTAGFHLTEQLLNKIRQMGITVVEITLHVGLGTFQPIRTDSLSDHNMHSEWVEISKLAADTINKAKKEGRRIIAVGTTTTRALEGVAEKSDKLLVGSGELNINKPTTQNPHFTTILQYTGDVNVFITPGFKFKIIDGLLTNFHLPKSTLLVLVSALAGRERVLSAYTEAVEREYRFYSFGDAMLIA